MIKGKSPARPPSAPVGPQAPRTPPPVDPHSDEEFEDILPEETKAASVTAAPRSTPAIRAARGSTSSNKRPGSSGQHARGTPPSGARIPEGGGDDGGGGPPAKGKKGRGGGGSEIGSLRVRGMALKLKFVIFSLLVTVPITLIFGLVAINGIEKQLNEEIRRSGYGQVLQLNAFATKIMERFRDVNNQGEFEELLKKYITPPVEEVSRSALSGIAREKPPKPISQKDDMVVLERIVKGDPRIKDAAIYSESPALPILRTVKSDKLALPAGNNQKHPFADEKVKIYRDTYGGEDCLYCVVPIEVLNSEGKPAAIKANAMLILSAAEVDKQVRSMTFQLGLFALLLIGAGVGLSVGLANRISRPINMLVDDINQVSQGDLDHESLVQNETSDEVGLLAMAFNRMTTNLRNARDKERDRERLESELNTAKAIHAKLMPEKLPQLPGIDIFTAYNCAKEVGGDYYDFIPVGDTEHLALCVADVSGKGIPGSMVMGTTRTILRMMAVNNLSAADVLSKTNFHVARDIKRGMFVTCVYVILNVRTREMTVASAGHNPMLIWRQKTNQIEKVRPNGIALGFDKGPVFNRTVREQKVQLFPGDRVVMYTDGVVEAMNDKREEWSDEALDAFTLKNAALPSKEYVRLLVKELDDHKGSAEQHDDITIMTFRVS